ncbi:hypothetical protein X798_01259 [Onchocerca flexuosa]|uniref:Uncharacterized protein n=1 Tax=Onchocerca flexuosa TaxID=387005 RepID=A0A238C1Q8_9BILA|nr:hypothetical protein X798_01259 [Onchocerca flexuosa]
MKSFWTGSNDIKILLQKNTFAQQDVTTRNVGINKFEKAEGSPGNSSIENTNENNVTLGKETINPSEFVTLPDDNEPIWNMRNAILPLPDRKESESNFQPIDNVIIGLIVGISIVVFLIIIINCFTFRVYLKETKDDRSFRNGITESSSSRISRNRAGCSPHFIY